MTRGLNPLLPFGIWARLYPIFPNYSHLDLRAPVFFFSFKYLLCMVEYLIKRDNLKYGLFVVHPARSPRHLRNRHCRHNITTVAIISPLYHVIPLTLIKLLATTHAVNTEDGKASVLTSTLTVLAKMLKSNFKDTLSRNK